MYSLFYALTNQHGDEFAPVWCDEQTIIRLMRYFEDVVTENKLSALVIEGRCLDGQPAREAERLAKLRSAARHLYLFSCDTQCQTRTWNPDQASNVTLLDEKDYHAIETGPFILVMDPRFCGLLSSSTLPSEPSKHGRTYDMFWTFDPNVVFTAIEYLMSRISVQKPQERARLDALLNASAPHNHSLRLALTLTTKLTLLMQRQSELEMATHRISSAISSTLELESILQSAVEEVGRALKARRAALVLWQEGTSKPEGMSVYEREAAQPSTSAADGYSRRDRRQGQERGQTGPLSDRNDSARDGERQNLQTPGPLEIPITYRNSVIGVLVVEDDTPGRDWEDEEELMVRTVSDQLAVAISHARLFRHVQTQAMTDALTGLYNHRYFQERLERELKLADRNDDKVSLILLDLDHLKRINDSLGHRAGDAALCHVARLMQATVRGVDVCARYGGEEFVVILPQCDREGAIMVAERLRESIASTPAQKIGQVTASIGVATYPSSARSKEELVEMADRAMYLAKAAGRNRVRTLMHHNYTGVNMEY
ncbi:MAG TPA: sensor domain-containing diguanylate cyclase [Blastocatellia bacterium]|nr:sensor domain-containing diguanylate cyclase [Blastocatellia bacterium]